MSRVPTIIVGLALLCGVAWFALTLDEIPFAGLINAVAANWLGTSSPFDAAAAVFVALNLGIAAGIGLTVGYSLRGQTSRVHHAELQRRLLDTKGRIPQLESGMRNREHQVARAEHQMKELADQIPSLQKSIDDGAHALRDRDRTISLLRGELTAIKGMPAAGDQDRPTVEGLDIDIYASAASVDDTRRKELEARLAELESQLHIRQARIAELMHEQATGAARIPELERALDAQRARSETFERERKRQDKWLDILNDQLARAREANDKLAGGLAQQQVLEQRIVELEGECKRLGEEIAERERRLASSRFE